MIHTVRCAFVALPLGLLLAGCSGNNASEFRSPSAAFLSGRTTDQGLERRVSGRDATSHNESRANMMAPAARYDITMNEIRERLRNNEVVIVDARGPADFAHGHVRGAYNVPAGQIEGYIEQLYQSVVPDQLIVIYCNGPHCDSGDRVYEYLVPQGFTNVRVFKPGWEAIASASDLR